MQVIFSFSDSWAKWEKSSQLRGGEPKTVDFISDLLDERIW